ncbi:response regulator transcription factor [Gemmatimonas phototrophica]|uniref:Response regulatory domain-containing protein n=1 Tax=Gemmatimonas phototrophica TaxID=1379270 RepID=A0A143BIT2_9BACT|nr:response regulator transcription factor [Gemmatimonas phototrophica]AMW04491.1 hypothetical protein GEMMAAP_05810 [Gemmatimonas phototrophica]
MIQVNSSTSPFPSAYTPTPGYGRPKRGTPDYAAKVRQQIARLAALHAASIVEAPPMAPVAIKSVLVVAGCPSMRDCIREALRSTSWMQVTEATSVEEGLQQLAKEAPSLMIVDSACADVLSSPAAERALLVMGQVPREKAFPAQVVGVLAQPLKADRVTRLVLEQFDK